VVVCEPSVCSSCEQPLRVEDADPQRRPVHELAAKLIHTTEYELHCLRSPCGAHTRAPLPSGVRRTPLGPSIQALAAVLDRLADLYANDASRASAVGAPVRYALAR
jgi:hypothetical protein